MVWLEFNQGEWSFIYQYGCSYQTRYKQRVIRRDELRKILFDVLHVILENFLGIPILRNQWPEDCFCSKLNIHHSRFCLPRRLNVIQWAVWFGSFTGHVAIHTIANGITLVVSALDDKTQSLANLSTNVICLKISLVLRFPTSPNLMTFEHKFLHGMV